MAVEPWIFWLILGPVAAIMALYVGYVVLLLLGLLSLTIGLCGSVAANWLTVRIARATTWGLRILVSPFTSQGPWLDYAAVALLLVGTALGGILWLAA